MSNGSGSSPTAVAQAFAGLADPLSRPVEVGRTILRGVRGAELVTLDTKAAAYAA
jgi:hypothetical protein